MIMIVMNYTEDIEWKSHLDEVTDSLKYLHRKETPSIIED